MSIPAHQRQSQWIVMERCLALLHRLMRGPASTEELLHIVEAHTAVDKEPEQGSLEKRFEKDRERLREFFGTELEYLRAERTYRLLRFDRALLDLPKDAVRAVAFLQATFGEEGTPMQTELSAFIDILMSALSVERRAEIERERGIVEIDLRKRDQDVIDDVLYTKLIQAVREHRELEFDYLSPGQDDQQKRRHRVEPYRVYFDSSRGHYYLEAYWIESQGPKGVQLQGKMQEFRLGRMSNAVLLPKKFVPGVHSVPKVELIYQLPAHIARYGVTLHIEDSEVEYLEDGTAVIRAKTAYLFRDVRKLLHYGASCQILGGPEALKMITKIVAAMYEQYKTK